MSIHSTAIVSPHARIHETEKEENDVHGILPGTLELVERIVCLWWRIGEEAVVTGGMRQERHNRHQREGRMQPAPKTAPPTTARQKW